MHFRLSIEYDYYAAEEDADDLLFQNFTICVAILPAHRGR